MQGLFCTADRATCDLLVILFSKNVQHDSARLSTLLTRWRIPPMSAHVSTHRSAPGSAPEPTLHAFSPPPESPFLKLKARNRDLSLHHFIRRQQRRPSRQSLLLQSCYHSRRLRLQRRPPHGTLKLPYLSLIMHSVSLCEVPTGRSTMW